MWAILGFSSLLAPPEQVIKIAAFLSKHPCEHAILPHLHHRKHSWQSRNPFTDLHKPEANIDVEKL
jgi:hypothetical protein